MLEGAGYEEKKDRGCVRSDYTVTGCGKRRGQLEEFGSQDIKAVT